MSSVDGRCVTWKPAVSIAVDIRDLEDEQTSAGPKLASAAGLKGRDCCTPRYNESHLALLPAFRPAFGTGAAGSQDFTWGATWIFFIMLPQEQRGLIPHSTSLDART
jgi:hypothetical protein